MPTFGSLDIIQDQSGNALANVQVKLYASLADAKSQVNLLASATTNSKGQWPVTVNGYDMVWVRDPAGNIWTVPSDTVAGDHSARLSTLESGPALTTSALDANTASLLSTPGSSSRTTLDGRYAALAAFDLPIYYVTASASASDSNTGRSWGNAFATVGAAVAALGANAGQIHVGPGTFPCNILIRSNQRIVGSGIFNTTLKSANGANADVIKGYNYAALTGTNQNGNPSQTAGDNCIVLSDLTVDGNKANNTSGYGIRIWGRGNQFTNVHAQNCAQDGIRTEFAHDVNLMRADLVESQYNNVRCLFNNGNGWSDYGPHDSVMNSFEAFSNGGWGHLSGSLYLGNATLSMSGATGGTFSLFLNGVQTAAIAYNATAAQVQSALTAVAGGSGITCTGGPLGTSAVTIAFPGPYLIDINPMGLTGGYGAVLPTLNRGTAIANGGLHGTQWDSFLNTYGGVYVGNTLDVDGVAGDGNAVNAGIGIYLSLGSGTCNVRGNVASCATGIIAAGSNHNISLSVTNCSGDGYVEAGIGMSIVHLYGNVPTGGNGIRYGGQFAIPGPSSTRARFTLNGTGTLTAGTLGGGFYELIGSGNGNPRLFGLPSNQIYAAGWVSTMPSQGGNIIAKSASGTTVGAAGAAAALPTAPVAYWTVQDENGTSFKIPVYNV